MVSIARRHELFRKIADMSIIDENCFAYEMFHDGRKNEAKEIIMAIESGIYEEATKHHDHISMIYDNYVHKVLYHLNPKNGYYLHHLIKNGKIKPDLMASTPTIDLNPDPTAKQREYIIKQRSVSVAKSFSKIYACRKCGQKTLFEDYHQHRALDEGRTLTLSCDSCFTSYSH